MASLRRVAATEYNPCVECHDRRTEAGPFTGRTDLVSSVAFSPDGQRIVSGLHDRIIRVWNTTTGYTEAGPSTGHMDSVTSVDFSPEASTSSRARRVEKFVCGTSRRERQQQAYLLDTWIRSSLWDSRQTVSASSYQNGDQFAC